MKSNLSLKYKIVLSGIVFSLAIIYEISLKIANEGTDSTFVILISLAVLLVILPWDNLTSFKAAGIELTLDKPQVKGALNSLKIDQKGKKLLEEKLQELASEIEQIKGSRILWVDDKPKEILGERRLLRSLGIEVVTAKDSESALRKIDEDNDFDVVISDAQRIGWGVRKETATPLFELIPDYKQYLKDGRVDPKLINVFKERGYDLECKFSWGDIPGNDNERLIEFLKKKFSIKWVETAEIEKIDDSTIRVYTKRNSLSLRLNDEKTKVNLKIDDGRTDEIIVKTENDKLNIYFSNAEIFKKDEKYWNIENEVDDEAEAYIVEDIGTRLNIYEGTIVDGLNFILNLRNSKDPIIKNMPVILYTAYTDDVLKDIIKIVTNGDEELPHVEISKSIDTLIELVINTLFDVRSKPIKVSPQKEPTIPG